jgi:hypothetical protein
MLAEIQQGLEQLYRIETEVDVRDFVIDESRRQALVGADAAGAEATREQLLVRMQGGELELGLYVDDRALRNLERHDPRRGLDQRNLDDFCLTLEGVSHFVYVIHRARQDRPVTGLELELQAEVDKYLACVLLTWDDRPAPELRAMLFGRVRFLAANDNERERYVAANRLADRYCRTLEDRFLSRRRLALALEEARRFYRLDQAAKLDTIAAAG